MAAIRAEHDFSANALRGINETASLVSEFAGKNQEPRFIVNIHGALPRRDNVT
jgi:hypothetical protein